MQTMSSVRRDFLASNIRSQLAKLRGVLDNIEEEEYLDFSYADESLKQIEITLRNLRRSCLDNN